MKNALEKYVAECGSMQATREVPISKQQATFGQVTQGGYTSLPSSIMNIEEQPSHACGAGLSNYFSSTLRGGELNVSRSRVLDHQLAIPKPTVGTDPPKVIISKKEMNNDGDESSEDANLSSDSQDGDLDKNKAL